MSVLSGNPRLTGLAGSETHYRYSPLGRVVVGVYDSPESLIGLRAELNARGVSSTPSDPKSETLTATLSERLPVKISGSPDGLDQGDCLNG